MVGFESLSYKQGTTVDDCSQLAEIKRILETKGYKTTIGIGNVNLNWEE